MHDLNGYAMISSRSRALASTCTRPVVLKCGDTETFGVRRRPTVVVEARIAMLSLRFGLGRRAGRFRR